MLNLTMQFTIYYELRFCLKEKISNFAVAKITF